MSFIKILESPQQREFDKPPKLSYQQRKYLFVLPVWAETEYKVMFDNIRIGFIIQIGYFKASGRFFKLESFQKDDFLFVLKKMKYKEISFSEFKMEYNNTTFYNHRQIILDNFGMLPFDKKQKELAFDES